MAIFVVLCIGPFEKHKMQELPTDNKLWAEATRSLWLKRGLKLGSGVPMADIESAELEIGFQFPIDMKDLYMAVNGFRDCDMDLPSMISIWPIERIREEYNAGSGKNFIGFCDFLINSHAIGFFKDRSGVFKCYDEFNPIAETFVQAIDLINTNSELLY